MKKFVICALLMVLAVPTLPALAQNSNMLRLDMPPTIRLKDMNGDWSRLSLGNPSGAGGDMKSQLMPLAMLGSMGDKGKGKTAGKGAEDPMAAMLGMSMLSGMFGGGGSKPAEPVYYTNGKLLSIGDTSFLVTYRYQQKGMDFGGLVAESMKNGGKEPDLSKMAHVA